MREPGVGVGSKGMAGDRGAVLHFVCPPPPPPPSLLFRFSTGRPLPFNPVERLDREAPAAFGRAVVDPIGNVLAGDDDGVVEVDALHAGGRRVDVAGDGVAALADVRDADPEPLADVALGDAALNEELLPRP